MSSLFRFPVSALAVVGLTAFAALVASPRAASAETFFTTTTAFNAAAPGNTLFTFEGIAPDGDVLRFPNLSPLSFVVSGGGNPQTIAIDSGFLGGAYTVIDGTDSITAGATTSAANPAITRINLGTTGQTFTAFASEIGQQNNRTNTYTIGLFLNDTPVGTVFSSGPTGAFFFGVTNSLPFDNVRVTTVQNSSSDTVFDNVRVGPAVVTAPEPGSLALLGLGMVGAIIVRRHKRPA